MYALFLRKNHPTRGTRGQNTRESYCIVLMRFFGPKS